MTLRSRMTLIEWFLSTIIQSCSSLLKLLHMYSDVVSLVEGMKIQQEFHSLEIDPPLLQDSPLIRFVMSFSYRTSRLDFNMRLKTSPHKSGMSQRAATRSEWQVKD